MRAPNLMGQTTQLSPVISAVKKIQFACMKLLEYYI